MLGTRRATHHQAQLPWMPWAGLGDGQPFQSGFRALPFQPDHGESGNRENADAGGSSHRRSLHPDLLGVARRAALSLKTTRAAAAALVLFHVGCGEKLDPVTGIVAPAPPATSAVPCWERDIRPLLVERCYACHGADRPFDFSSLQLARLSLDPMRSKLRSEQMPPDGPLDTAKKNALLRWIDSGGLACPP